MKKVLVGILAIVGLFTVLGVLAIGALGLLSVLGQERVPGRAILEIDFEAGVIEAVPVDALAQLMLEDTPQLRDLVDALDRAAEDSRVKALVARIGGGGMGMAHIQELRDAVARFRDSGKPAIAFAETFGEFGPGNGGYYLATAFDEIYLQPSGDIGMTGLMYETSFIAGLLDKLGVAPRMGQRYEYKNAMNYYTHTEYTEPHRRAMRELMESQFDQIVRAAAAARDLSEEQVRALFDNGPYLGAEAVEAGLVDGLAYRDEVYAKVREVAGDRADLIYASRYLERAGSPHRRGATIALVHGYGAVVRGRGGYSPVDGSVRMGADSVTQALRAAIRDRRVKAIVLRVDSPGGSYVASDSIWRETLRAREADKPVIVSMGNVAASGGYFVAMDGDKIVAQPGTITGSIGVLGGKLLTDGFWDKIGVSFDDVQSSANAAMWSSSHDYTAHGRSRLEAGLDRIYADFTQRVAAGRGLPLERVLEIARGRIWTGEDARKLGLVDELGGVDVALRLAREAIGLEADAPVKIKRFPPPSSAWELLFTGRENSERAALEAVTAALRAVQPTVRLLAEIRSGGVAGPLAMPAIPSDP